MQLYHRPACWKMSQPSICMALVVITGMTAACFCLGWCSRQDGQVRISLLICSVMSGQNHLSLALWIDLSIPWWTRCSLTQKLQRKSTLYPKMQTPTVFSTLPELRNKLRRTYAKWKKSEGTTTWEKLKPQRSSDNRRSPPAKSPRLPVTDAPRASTTARDVDANMVPNSALPMGKNVANAKGRATLLSSAVAREMLNLPASGNKYPDPRRSFTNQQPIQKVAKQTSQSTTLTRSLYKLSLEAVELELPTVAHKGHAANKKETLQTKKERCKQKRNAANKKETLQTKKKRCKQKRNAANKKETLQTKKKRCKQKRNAANKKETLQTKKKRCKQKRNAANKKESRCKQKRETAANKKRNRCKQKRNAANKRETLQTKKKRCKQKRNAANKKQSR